MPQTTAKKSDNKSDKKALFLLFLVVLIDLIGFGMILPLIPFIGKSLSSSAPMVGLLMSIYSIMQFLFSPFWGALSDRYGRKPILLISILGASVSHFFFALASTYWALFAARLFAGLFSANISTAMAAAADLSPPEKRTQSMGIIGAAFGLGFVLGPFLGAQGAELGKHFGYNEQFSSLLAAGLCLFNFFFCLFYFKESLLEKGKKISVQFSRLNPLSGFLKLTRPLKFSVGLFFAASLALAIIEIVLFYVVKEQYDWNYQKAALGFAAIGLVMAFTQGGLIRPLKKRFSELQLILAGASLFSLGLLGSYFLNSLYLFSASVLFFSLGYAILNPSLNALISLQAKKGSTGSSFGVTHSFSALSRILGPLIGTTLLEQWGLKSPFLLSAFVILLALSVFVSAFRRA